MYRRVALGTIQLSSAMTIGIASWFYCRSYSTTWQPPIPRCHPDTNEIYTYPLPLMFSNGLADQVLHHLLQIDSPSDDHLPIHCNSRCYVYASVCLFQERSCHVLYQRSSPSSRSSSIRLLNSPIAQALRSLR